MADFPQNFGAGDDDAGPQMISGINVTPLVDITLVLLIIFMVTATVIVNAGIKVELPKAASGTDQTKTTLALTLMKDGTLYLNGEKSSDQGVTRFIGETLPRRPDLQAIIAADRVVPHGRRRARHRSGQARGRTQIRHQCRSDQPAGREIT